METTELEVKDGCGSDPTSPPMPEDQRVAVIVDKCRELVVGDEQQKSRVWERIGKDSEGNLKHLHSKPPSKQLKNRMMNERHHKVTRPTRLNILDFGGQVVYRHGHPLFLAPHAVYVVVFSLARSPDAPGGEAAFREHILFWLKVRNR